MAWDGSGNFTRTNGTQTGSATWQDSRDVGNNILASQHDTHDQDLADGINDCLTRNGEAKLAADFVPAANATYDLGLTGTRWQDLFLSGNADIGGQVILGGDISPSQLTGNTNDWAPTGLSGASRIRFSTDARRNITGLTGGSDGRRVTLHNIGTFPACFKIDDGATSTAANRFAFACTLGGGQSMEIEYDGTTARWRAVHLPEPIGTVKDFATSTMPEGFLAIDQNVSRTTYASLFNEIGTSYGTGDGSLTFGLYLGAGAALIAAGTGTHTDSGDNADVDTGNDTLTVPANDTKWITGKLVTFTLASGTITGLTSGNPYYVVRNSSTTIKLASTLANAQNGTVIDLTAKSSPVWTITHTHTARTHGDRLGEESHALSSTEQLAHTHSATIPVGNSGAGAIGATSSNDAPALGTFGVTTASTGNNNAMNNMPVSTVVTRGIRYC